MLRIWTILTLVSALGATVLTQSGVDPERAAAITVMRAINTAENATSGRGGTYVHLTELLEHPAMARVKPTITVSDGVATHQGATIRLALSSDGKQYQVSIVPAKTCGWAAFSDERGLIYTGKVLDCK